MALADSIKGFYFSAEEKYYHFLDWLDDKGIPVYKAVDAIESANIPSFPIFVLLVVAILAVIIWLVMGFALAGSSALTFVVTDSQDNPIGNAVVAIQVGDSQPVSALTNSEGKLERTFPLQTELSGDVSKDGFKSETFSLTLTQATETKTIQLETTVQTLAKTVNFVDGTTGALFTEPVHARFSCSGNPSFSFEGTTSTGSLIVTSIPEDCGTLTAQSLTTGVQFGEATIDYSSPGVASLSVSTTTQETGTVQVTVKNSRNEPVAAVNVKLMRENDTQFTSRPTASTGIALFEEVPVGSYYIYVTDVSANPRYADYDSSVKGDIKELAPNASIEFSAALQEVVFGKIRLKVVDAATNQPVANASATLIKDKIEITTLSTNETGSVEFSVSDTAAEYAVRIDNPSYLIANVGGLKASDSITEIRLQPATGQETALTVIVLDPNGLPVENAQVQLKKNSDGSIASEVLSTGTDGKALFTRLAADTYFAFVSKEGFEGIASNPVAVLERQPASVTVVLPIGSGTLAVTVLDDGQQPVAGANIQLKDVFTGTVLEEKTSGSDGKASFIVRADKTVFFSVETTDFVPYNTKSLTVPVDSTREVSIQLIRDITKLEVQFNGLYLNDEVASDTLDAGQRYTAHLLLLVPPNVEWSEAGVHIRTGASDEGSGNIMEADYLYLGKAWSAATATLRGKSYSPPLGFSEDAKHLTTGNSKWLNLAFANPTGGAYEIETEVQVLDSVPIGSMLPFSYRAWGKTAGSVSRFPADQVLGNSENTAAKQGLYAVAKDHPFSAGPTTLCNDQFCYLLIVRDLQQNLNTTVTDEFPAKISSDYKLFFTLVNKSNILNTKAQFEIANDQGGLAFKDYKITDSQGRPLTGNADGQSKLLLDIADFGKDSTVFGEITFETVKEGANDLKLSLQSNSQPVLEKKVLINVEAIADMNVDILPKTIAPFLNNDLLIKVSDPANGNPLPGTIIELYINNQLAVSGNTDSQGVFKYTLQAPAPNWVIKIVARKTGFATITKEMKVSSSILTIIPDSISDSLTVTGIFGFEKDMILSNNSVYPATITQIDFSRDMESLLKTSVEDGVIGTKLEPGQDTNFLVRIELTDKAKQLMEAADVKGSMGIQVTVAEMQKTWVLNVPIQIHIGFGGEVLDQNCFSLNPGNWNVVSSSSGSQAITIALQNSCKIEQTFVAISDLKAYVQTVGGDNLLGSFSLASSMVNNRTLSLTSTAQALADGINANKEESLTLTFAPNPAVKSGQTHSALIIQGTHMTSNGPQLITASFSIDQSISNLSACVEVLPVNMIVYSTPPGIGYGMYSSYGYGGYGNNQSTYMGGLQGYGGVSTGLSRFDYTGNQGNFYNNLQNGTQTVQGNPTVVDYPERLYSTNYPYSGYSAPFYDTWAPYSNSGYTGADASYYGNQFGNFNYLNSTYGRGNQLRITNSCNAPVEISFDADPALLVHSNKITMDPDSQQTIGVESTQYYGLYPLNVRAKLPSSQLPSQVIQTVNVNVFPADDPTQYEDCIKISTTKFKFNDLLQKPVTAKIYNSCFAQGVRIDMDSISFSNLGYGEKLAMREGSSGIIEEIEPIDLHTSAGGSGMQQELEFEVYKNIAYRPQLTGGPLGGTGGEGLVDMRTWVTGAYNRVEASAQLVVRFSSPQGSEQRKMFHVTVEDYWNMFGSFPPLSWNGNPNIKPEACLIDNALDYGPCLSEDDFKNKNTYTFGGKQVVRVGPNPYGTSNQRTYFGSPGYGSSAYGGSGYLANGSNAYGYGSTGSGYANSTGYPNDRYNQYSTAGTTVPQPYPYYSSNYTMPNGSPYGTMGGTTGMPLEITNVCGSMDQVSMQTQTITKNGVKFTFYMGADDATEGKESKGMASTQGIKLKIDKSGANVIGDTRLETKVKLKVTRQNPFGTEDLQVPVSVCVTIGKTGPVGPGGPGGAALTPEIKPVPNASTTPDSLCQNTKTATGQDVYNQNLGYLLLDWDWSLGKKDTDGTLCNATKNGKFCDATQYTITLVKKTLKIKNKLKEPAIANAIKTNEANMEAASATLRAINPSFKLDDIRSTEIILLWLKKQQIILDNAKGGQGSGQNEFSYAVNDAATKLVFLYAKGDNAGLLEKEKINTANLDDKSIATAITTFNAATGDNKNNTKLDMMGQILQKLGKETKIDSKGILITINWAADAGQKATLEAIGADNIGGNNYVLTLNEFGFLHQEIRKNCINTDGSDKAGCTVNGKLVTKEFLSGLVDNMKVMLAARNDLVYFISTAYSENAISNAAWADGITEENAAEVTSLVYGTVNLIGDNYSAKFKADFASFYGNQTNNPDASSDELKLAGTVSNWEYRGFLSVTPAPTETAVYENAIDYQWVTNKVNISHKKAANQPAKKLDNPLYYLPFDASLHSANADYGTAFTGGSASEVYLNAMEKPNGESGKNTVSLQFVDDFSGSDDARKGQILAVTGTSYSYSPSAPFGFILSGGLSESKGVLFRFKDNKQLDGTIQWKGIASEGKGSQNAICKNGKGEDQFSLLQKDTTGLFFLPIGTQQAVFELLCATESANLKINQGTGTSKLATKSLTASKNTGSDATLPLQAMDTKTIMNLKALAEAVKNKQVCISATKDSMTLAWNPVYVLNGS